MSTRGSPTRATTESTTTANADQLYKIESKPPTISVKDMANHIQLAIHLLRVKAAAAHHGFVNLLIDPNSTHDSPCGNVSMHRRWIIESFECRDVRTLLAMEGEHPYHVWQAIPRLLMPGVELNEIYNEWIQTIKWDENTNIASYFANFQMISKELERLGEPISNRRLKQLYVRALPETYGHVIDAANMHCGDNDDPKVYISYINKAINQRLARNLEPLHGSQNDHPVFHTRVIEKRRPDGRRSPNRRCGGNNDSFNYSTHLDADSDRAERYGEATISRATAEILNEYGCHASTDLVEKVSRMIGDYLLFERQEEEHEAYATDSRYRTATRRSTPPDARQLQRTAPDNRRGSQGGSDPGQASERNDTTSGRLGRSKICSNCGNEGCRARTCPQPKARCSHQLCRQRGRDGHCDKACFFQNRHLCPQNLLDARDRHLAKWEKEQRDKHAQANYVDEDQSSDDFMQLDDTTNYYFYNIDVEQSTALDRSEPESIVEECARGHQDLVEPGEPQREADPTNQADAAAGAETPPHCIDYLADLSVRMFYNHLLHLAERTYSRSRTPIHTIIDVALSVIIDYLRRCSPASENLTVVKRFADLHTPSTLELVKGMCHDAVIESVMAPDGGETLAMLLWRCFRSFSYLNDVSPMTRAFEDSENRNDHDGNQPQGVDDSDTPPDTTGNKPSEHIMQTMIDSGVYNQTHLDAAYPRLRRDDGTNTERDCEDASATNHAVRTRVGDAVSERAHLDLDAPALYYQLRRMSHQNARNTYANTGGDASTPPRPNCGTSIYDYLTPSTATWRMDIPVPKCDLTDALWIAKYTSMINTTSRRHHARIQRRARPYFLPRARRLQRSPNVTHRTSDVTDADDNQDVPTTTVQSTTDDTSNTDAGRRPTGTYEGRTANILRIVQASVARRRRREQLGMPACECLWATANGQTCNPLLAASDYQRITSSRTCMHCTPTCQCACEGCTIPFLDEHHPCSCGVALTQGGFCTGVPSVFDSVGRTQELRRCEGCADPAQCQCPCPLCIARHAATAASSGANQEVHADDVDDFDLYALQHECAPDYSVPTHDAPVAPSATNQDARADNEDDYEHHALQHERTLNHAATELLGVAPTLPAALRCMTYTIVDTGASTHLENGEGCAGFETRDGTTATVSTGLSTRSPCDFTGTHVQYMLGCAPAYEIICFKRPSVLCHKTFKRSLFSVRAAWADSRIKARFDDECVLLLADGRRIPFYQLNNTYVLPRWFDRADAESARALLLSSARAVPLTCSSGHDDWVQAALHRATHGPEFNHVDHATNEFLDDDHTPSDAPNDGAIALVPAPARAHAMTSPRLTAPVSVVRALEMYHRRFGHLAPKALLQLPNAVIGADELRRVTREQAEHHVGRTCDTCARARMTRKPHQKRDLRTHSTTDPVHAFGDCVSTDNAGPLPASYAHFFRYLTVFVDHYTSLIAVYFHTTKGLADSIPVREQYIADHSVYGPIKRFLSDSARELMGRTMRTHLARHHQCGVVHTVPGESDLNTRAEAAICLLFAMARALRIQSGVPTEHWPAMVLYAAYIRNRVPLRSTRDGRVTTRLALARGQPHTIAEIRTFGCVCHGLVQRKNRDNKMSDVALSGIFMGFPRYQQGGAVCIWIPNDSKQRYRVTYSVRFDESRTYQDAWRLTPAPLLDETTTHRRLHQTATPTQHVEERAIACDDDGTHVPTLATTLRPEDRANCRDDGAPGETTPPVAPTEPTRPPLDPHACGRVDPVAARRHPSRPTDFACRLPDGHLGNCDWESLRPLRTPVGTRLRTAPAADEAAQLCMYDEDNTTDDQEGDFVFDCLIADAPAAHWSASHCTPHVLLVFSGDTTRDDSLAARLRARGVQVTSYDLQIGGRRHDLTRREVLDEILHKMQYERYDYVFASPPCSSFSVAAADGRAQLRSKRYPEGVPEVPNEWTAYLRKHNKLIEATTEIIKSADKLGVPWTIENPADRSDRESPAYWPRYEDQGSIWDLLGQYGIGKDGEIKANIITIPTCSFGTEYQKYTTFLCSNKTPLSHPSLHTHRCQHTTHTERLYGNRPGDDHPRTQGAEQYPPRLADTLAAAIVQTATRASQDELNQLTYYTKMAKAKSKSKRPKTKQCRIDDILRHIPIPTSYRQVLRHEFRDDIIDAMVKEHDEHLRNKTWVGLVPRTPDMNVVGSTWVWDIKRHVDKCILRFKARLCAQGFTQIKGVDYFRKYSHAVSLETLRLFLAKCAMAHLLVTEADYTTAYLNAKLDIKIYMRQAEGFEERDEDGNLKRGPNGEELVYELDKAIYGLIQSGLMWEEEHWGTLKELGWEQCTSELTIFKKVINGTTCFLCTYVDNLFMGFPPGSTDREELLKDLGMRYKINDLGEVKFSLGLCVLQNLRLGTTTIHQQPLINEVAATYEQDVTEARFGQRNTPYHTAGEPDVQHLDRNTEECKKWQKKSLKLAGKLNYIAIGTRPDIAGALSMAMQHVAHASGDTFKLLLCIVKYLSVTTNYAIQYQRNPPAMFVENALMHCSSLSENPWRRDGDISVFCDASQGGARPMMCAIVFIAGAPLTWRMGKLRATTLSSTEAEWFAQTTGAAIMQTFDGTLTFLELEPQKPVLSFCDNKSAVLIAESDLSTKRMKHVLTKMAYLQERINEKLITIVHIGNEGMLADIGTKRLSPSAFHRLRAFLVRPYAMIPTMDDNTVKRLVTTDEDASSGGASWTVEGGEHTDVEPVAAGAATN